MKTRLAPLLAALLLVFSGNLFAIGLGELKLESGLNQPFKARITLVKTGDLSAEDIHVKLAPDADFVAHNMSRDQVLTTLHFTVDLHDKSGPVVLVTTDQPVKEPSLDFLVEMEWPKGKVVRAYTVLLEKP